MKPRNEKGFTLLEILVVISLILIIAGIALPKFIGVASEGKKAKAAAELKTLQTALESYLLTNSSSPNGFTGAPGSDTLEGKLETATPRLIGDVSKFYDPFGDFATTNYRYEISPVRRYYVMWSEGPNLVSSITGINDSGVIQGSAGDDIYVSNGSF